MSGRIGVTSPSKLLSGPASGEASQRYFSDPMSEKSSTPYMTERHRGKSFHALFGSGSGQYNSSIPHMMDASYNHMQAVSFHGVCNQCGLQTTPANQEELCVSCHRYQKYRQNYTPSNFREIEDPGPPLPGAILLLSILLLAIVGCFLGVLRYGVGIHQKIAHQWIAAVFIGLFLHILILEPMKVLLVTYHMSFTERRILN